MYKLVIALRYLFRKWIALFAVLSVWLCVAMVLIVFSVMDGFLENIKQHSRGLLSDIIVDNSSLQGFPYYEEFEAFARDRLPGVIDCSTPVIYNYGIMRDPVTNFTKPVRTLGIRLNEYSEVNDFRNSLFYERYYPGTTTLRDVQIPVVGIGPNGEIKMPPGYEEAWKKHTPPPERDRILEVGEKSFSSPNGVGVFATASMDEAGFAGNPLPGIVLGTDLVYHRRPDGRYDRSLERGAEIILTLLPLTARGTLAQDPVKVVMRHIDDSRTKVYEIDQMAVYVDFDLAQRLLAMDPQERMDGGMTPARTSQLLIQLTPGHDATQVRAQLEDLWVEFVFKMVYGLDEAAYGRLELDMKKALWQQLRWGFETDVSPEDCKLLQSVGIETWRERQHNYITAVEKEKVLVTILFGIISLVAIVMIGVVFYMIVLQKTRDVGILKSVGATRGGVAMIFLSYGAAVGVFGGILGVVSGTIFVHYINEIQDILASINPQLQVWTPDIYTFDRIPNVVKTHVAVLTFFAAVGTSMVGALFPAIKAARVWPVEALRYE